LENKRRLIFCFDSPGFGGSEVNLIKLVSFLKKSFQISFITTVHPSTPLTVFIDDNQFEQTKFCVNNKFSYVFLGIFKSLCVLRKQPTGILIFWNHHINSSRWLEFSAALLRLKYIVVEQLLPTDYKKPAVSLTTRFIKKIILSRAYKTIICAFSHEKNYQTNFNAKNIFIVPNTRDVKCIFEKINFLRNTATRKSDFVISCVGRLSDQKNQETLISAFAALKTDRSVELLLVGGGENFDKHEKYIHDNKIQNVTITGYTTDVYKYLAETDLFVLPSLYEGLPGALIEAMSAKLPCIASNIPGNNELIIDKVTGYVFEPGNVNQLVSIIELLIENPDELKRIAENGFCKVLSEYNETIEMESWKKILTF
jgi:glycosyltransferase involved in cell wall biosynthesis